MYVYVKIIYHKTSTILLSKQADRQTVKENDRYVSKLLLCLGGVFLHAHAEHNVNVEKLTQNYVISM